MSLPSFGRLVRFIPKSSDETVIGEPVNQDLDVGVAIRKGEDVEVNIYSGTSILSPGSPTGKIAIVGKLLSPLAQSEVGTIRCVGLNYTKHALETNNPIPTIPTIFLKPSTALANPFPDPTIIPKWTLKDDTADYESELVIVIGKAAKNVTEEEALDYVLGYTAANDVSSRTQQFAQSQWNYSKGFDGACPLGPVVVSKELIPDVNALWIKGIRNGEVKQDSGINDLVFSVQKIVSFISQGTTLPAGTIILTGTPAGVGLGFKPPQYLHDGDEFGVEILPYIGTLITRFEAEK